jgi:tRNA A-37 threonylcarbamoyl transferase component Bud32
LAGGPLKGLLFWGLLGLSAWGQQPITINTQPTGAEIRDEANNFLGESGQSIDLDFKGQSVTLYLSREGYQRAQLVIQKSDLLGRKTWPEKPLVLQRPTPVWLYASPLLLLPLLLLRRRRSPLELAAGVSLEVVPDSGSLAGKTIGRYRLLERIGVGGMATVYKGLPAGAKDASQVVAIKVMRRELLADPEAARRFERETAVTAQLNHPNIVRVTDSGQQDGLSFLALEWMQGGTLRKLMNHEAIAFSDIWDVLSPLCSAIAYAHSQGVIHRDLKPENIMVTESGVLKVTDFGLARSGEADRITATGAALGTPAYMPPEQIQGGQLTPAMDQYALGIIAYELVTGRLPFQEADALQQIFKTMMEEVPPPSQFREVPPAVDAVLLRMLAKEPSERYPSVEAAALELRGALLG